MNIDAIQKLASGLSGWTLPRTDGPFPKGICPETRSRSGRNILPRPTRFSPCWYPCGRIRPQWPGSHLGLRWLRVGKSEIASLLSHYFRSAGIGSYTWSGDNYPLRIPMYNDAERNRIFRVAGLRGLVDAGVYNASVRETLSGLWQQETDADPACGQPIPGWPSTRTVGGRLWPPIWAPTWSRIITS